MTDVHAGVEETIAAYALDALAPDERIAALPGLLDHVSGCASCRETFNDYRDVAGDLALGAPALPVSDALEARVMSAIRAQPQAPAPRPARPRWLMRVVLAASLSAVLALGALSFTAMSDLRDERARTGRTSRALALVADPSARRVVLTGDTAATGGSVSMAIAADGTAVLVGTGLPRIDADRVFELWLMRDGTPIPAGVFRAEDGLALLLLDRDPRDFDAAAITIEPGPAGTAAPTSDVIFSAPLDA